MIGTINAIGNTVPPYFIFPRSHFVKESMLAGVPVDSAGCAAKSRWINKEILVKYLEHFIQFTKCSTENPVLLIMENHASHIFLTALLMGRKRGILVVTIYPHTSHKLQPLNCTVYGLFKRYYNLALDNWMKENPATAFSIIMKLLNSQNKRLNLHFLQGISCLALKALKFASSTQIFLLILILLHLPLQIDCH